MRNRLAVVFFLLLCFLVPQLIFAQSFTLNGNGARAAGMGYAFTGVADDATAISWNAAGLTQLYSMEASIVGRFGFGSLSTDYSTVDYQIDMGSSFKLNFASFVAPFTAGDYNIVVGVAYRNIYDFTSKAENTVTFSDGEQYKWTDDEKGGINAVTPAVAFQLSEIISFGAAVNILMGDYTYDYSNSFDETYNSSVDYSGMIIDLSTLIKPSPQFSIGASVSLPNTVTFDGKDSDGDTWETEMGVPLFFNIGAAFRATDNFSIAADYRNRAWSKREIEKYTENGIEWEDPGQYFTEYPDANSIHVGLEYLLEAGNNFMPLRLGFYTLPTTSREEPAPGQEDEDADQISYNAITAGIGLVMPTIILDGSFEYIFGSYVGDYEDGTAVDYNYSDIKITLGATIHFGQ